MNRVRLTSPPGLYVVLFDGQCKFCIASARHFVGLMGPVRVEWLDFQLPGVLERFPGLTHQACMRAMQLITPRGRVHEGAEAIAEGLGTRGPLRLLTVLYYAPLVREVCDLIYSWIAAIRYRIMGKAVAAGECEGGTCSLHVRS